MFFVVYVSNVCARPRVFYNKQMFSAKVVIIFDIAAFFTFFVVL